MALPKKTQFTGFVAWLAITFVAAAAGSIASITAATFYSALARPAWAPPPTVFGPVWTILYTLMAISAWLAWREGGLRAARTALVLFLLQLVANALWSWLFFAWHRGAFALADILLLWLLVAGTMAAFWRIKPLAGALLVPYLLWVGFATALNYEVWRLNPGILG